MKWTKKKPTEPGWYWTRDTYRRWVSQIVRMPSGGILFYDHPQRGAINIPRSLEFAGPIPSPEEWPQLTDEGGCVLCGVSRAELCPCCEKHIEEVEA